MNGLSIRGYVNFMNHMNNVFDPTRHTKYTPKNPEKYIGKTLPICRSSWESYMCAWFDHTTAVLQWCSECIAIKYQDPALPIKKNGSPNIRNYYPDFFAVIQNKDGTVEKLIIEIKPSKETRAPRKDKRKTLKTALYENKTWMTNQAKWAAAQRFCDANGLKFKLITEKQIFGR